MFAVSELELGTNEASAPRAVAVRSTSAEAPSSEILGIAANLRAARLTNGDRSFLFCPACDVKHPGSFAEQVALGLLHLDGPSVLVVHLHRSQDDPHARLAASRYAVITESLTDPPHPALCLAYPMLGGNTATVATPEFTRMLAEARKQFNYVLVDCPPLQKSAAALLLAPESGRSILTVPAGRARHGETQTACDSLRRAGAKLMGFVLIQG